MFLSTCMLNSAWCGYRDSCKMKYHNASEVKNLGPVASVMAMIMLVFALILFVFEIIVVIYAILMALRCTKSGPERIVHIVLALTFTLPYVLIMSVFNSCGQKVLRGSK